MYCSQKLAFSDDEEDDNFLNTNNNRRQQAPDVTERGDETKCHVVVGRTTSHTVDEDEVLAQKRRQQHQVLASAAEKARQRKEEEEKRYLETKLGRSNKHDFEERAKSPTAMSTMIGFGTIASSLGQLPDLDRSKEKTELKIENDEKVSGRSSVDLVPLPPSSDFRQLTQIEGRNFARRNMGNLERDSRNSPSAYAKHQKNLPPRMQKQQQQLRNTCGSPQPQYVEHRWSGQAPQSFTKTVSAVSGRLRQKSEWGDVIDKDKYEKDRFDKERGYTRYNSEESVLSGIPKGTPEEITNSSKNFDDLAEVHQQDVRKIRDKIAGENGRLGTLDDHVEDWHRDSGHNQSEKLTEKFSENRKNVEKSQAVMSISVADKFERPDSRNSRTSRMSRDSVGHSSAWTDVMTFDERRREDRRAVPGPITKEKIEADERQNEHRNLTQLRRGGSVGNNMGEKSMKLDRAEEAKQPTPVGNHEKDSEQIAEIEKGDTLKPTPEDRRTKKSETPSSDTKDGDVKINSAVDTTKHEAPIVSRIDVTIIEEKRSVAAMGGSSRNRSSQGWDRSNGVVSRWFKKTRTLKSSRGSTKSSTDCHGTDSDGSQEEYVHRSPKSSKKLSNKDENKTKDSKHERNYAKSGDKHDSGRRGECYEPRGEPSRYGRGGSNARNRGGGGGGGLSKRIDGYGPPPTKSPFGHIDERDKHQQEIATDHTDSIPGDKLGTGRTPWEPPSTRWDSSNAQWDEQERIGRRPNDKKGRDDNGDSSEKSDASTGKSSSSFTTGNRSRNTGPRRTSNVKSSSDRHSGSFGSRLCLETAPKSSVDIECKEMDRTSSEVEIKQQSDSDGFQEVKSKKNIKERQKPVDEKNSRNISVKVDSLSKTGERKGKLTSTHLSQQQIANIPSLMDTPVNPPPTVVLQSKGQSQRQKLPPRFLRQKENSRLQKVQQMHHQQHGNGSSDIGDLASKVSAYTGIKEPTVSPIPLSNAWEKPLSAQLRAGLEANDTALPVRIDGCKIIDQQQQQHPHSPGRTVSPITEKVS